MGKVSAFFLFSRPMEVLMGRMEEILLIVFIALLLFGSARLPELAKSFGKAIQEFKNAAEGKEEKKKEK
jgi:TatA/E family protein of Tat protein translocase